MKISENWLREWVNPPLDGKALMQQLTMAGLEVDSYQPVASQFTKIIVAEVLETSPHPAADKLTLCKINDGSAEPLPVVCGARNVRPGLKVALATLGAKLPGDFLIKESKLRGETSKGMLCSASELGLEEKSEGIIELPAEAPVGKDIREYLQLDDYIFEIDLTPNRGDCLSVQGLAREIAALNGLSIAALDFTPVQPKSEQTLPIALSFPEACPAYAARVISGLDNEVTSPLWLVERLRRSGLRSVNLVVDVCNYVMLELGQPLHAFDLGRIEAGIEIRAARAGESLVLLDGQKIQLDTADLVIADQQKPLALAGIMGAANSAVQASTTAILLESAYFDPRQLATTARRHHLFSDALQRFERGVDPAIHLQALERASALLLEITAGTAGPIKAISSEQYYPKPRTIAFRPGRCEALTGILIPEERMASLLKNLGINGGEQGSTWQLSIPSHRFDLQLEVDLIEEVLRLHGYDKLLPKPMFAELQTIAAASSVHVKQRIAEFLVARAYRECISYSFVDPEIQEILYPEQSALKLLNPISQELSSMRLGLWPGLVAAMVHNMHRQQQATRIFEMGVVFQTSGQTVQEQPAIAGLITGETGSLNWSETSRFFDFFDAKGDLEALFTALNISDIEFKPTEHPALHPGKAAELVRGEQVIGYLGSLHPRIQEALDLSREVLLFEIRLDALSTRQTAAYQGISKFPQIRRDLSFLVDQAVSAAAIEAVVRSLVPKNWFKSCDFFDLYMGSSVPEGKKSMAIALCLQDKERTLVDEEIQTLTCAIINRLRDDFDIILRD